MADEPEFKLDDSVTDRELLFRIYRELRTIRENTGKALFAMHGAEAEVSEKMRRFVMYWHDLHDIINIYEERGHQPPAYVLREMERCDDRFRQLLEEAHEGGGTFEKVKREMAQDPFNRWDHTKALPTPKHLAKEKDQ